MPPSASEGALLSSLRPLVNKAAQQVAGKASCAASTAMSGAALGAGAAERLKGSGLPQLIFTSSAAHGHVLAGHVEQPARVDTVMERLGAITGSSAFQAQVGVRAGAACCADFSLARSLAASYHGPGI